MRDVCLRGMDSEVPSLMSRALSGVDLRTVPNMVMGADLLATRHFTKGEAGKLVPRSQASVRLVNSVTAELKRKARGARPSPPGLRAVRPVLFHASRCTQRSFKTTPPSTRRSRRY